MHHLEARQLLSGSVAFDPSSFYPADVLEVNGNFYFTADDGQHGRELWTSDGTARGTRMVADLTPGSGSTDIFDMNVVGDEVLFFVQDPANGRSLWTTDTAAQNVLHLAQIDPEGGSAVQPSAVVNGNLVFVHHASTGPGLRVRLWVSDGTVEGTGIVKYLSDDTGSHVAHIFTLPDTGIFLGADGRLWRTDGTGAGTFVLREHVQMVTSEALNFTPIDDWFIFNDSSGIWRTDGTIAETKLISPMGGGNFANFEDRFVYLHSDGGQHWLSITDGTSAGTGRLPAARQHPRPPGFDG
jgi:ELWxxDGT repeat protein